MVLPRRLEQALAWVPLHLQTDNLAHELAAQTLVWGHLLVPPGHTAGGRGRCHKRAFSRRERRTDVCPVSRDEWLLGASFRPERYSS